LHQPQVCLVQERGVNLNQTGSERVRGGKRGKRVGTVAWVRDKGRRGQVTTGTGVRKGRKGGGGLLRLLDEPHDLHLLRDLLDHRLRVNTVKVKLALRRRVGWEGRAQRGKGREGRVDGGQ